MKTTCQNICPALGRALLSAIFIMSGIHKIMNFDDTAAQIAGQGLVLVPVILVAGILLELGGGLSVLLGCWARLGAIMLIIFLIPTTVIFHDFWSYQGEEQQNQMIHFMKNVALLGGLLLIVGFGAGPWSADHRSTAAREKPEGTR